MKWLERVPVIPLAIVALVLALAPFQPEPHLWEKLKMLVAGNLVSVVDIFDLLFHASPLLLLLFKLAFVLKQR